MAQTVTISNTGNAPLTITGLAASGSFNQTNNCGNTVAAGARCTINVTFSPTAVGAGSGMLTMNDDAPGSPHIVALSGTGVDFVISSATGSSTSSTVSAGQTANYALSISGTTGFSGTVALTCNGAPSASTCSVSPSSVAVSDTSPATVTVSVATTSRSTLVPLPKFRMPQMLWYPTWILLLILSWALVEIRLRHPAVRRYAWSAVVVLWALSFVGCGGGGGGGSSPPPPPRQGTPAGTYTLQVNAASGGATRSISLTLVVQ